MRKAWPVMGTVVSLEIPTSDAKVFKAVADLFERVDQQFSPYKTTSEVSLYASGRLELVQVSSELKQIILACERHQKKTGGYFSAFYQGRFDPTGYVKGWAIAKAGELIEKCGYPTYCLGVGGDLLARSKNAKIWRIGISNPKNTKNIVATVQIKNGAVATSGNYERGRHIYNTKTGRPADYWQSVTVINKEIIEADVWATAAFAMAEKAPAELSVQNLDFMLIDKAGHVLISDGAKALTAYS